MDGLETSYLLEQLAEELEAELDLEMVVSGEELEGELPLEQLYSFNGFERWQSRLFEVLEAFQEEYDVDLSIDLQDESFLIQLLKD